IRRVSERLKERGFEGSHSRTRRFNGDAKPLGVRNAEIELLKPDHPSGGVFHEDYFVTRLLAHVFLARIAEPDGKRSALTIVEHAHFGHMRVPSLIGNTYLRIVLITAPARCCGTRKRGLR